MDTSNYVWLAMTLYGWASHKTSEAKAVAALARDHGDSHIKRYGYVTYRVHPDFEVSQIDGAILTPAGHPTIKVSDKIVRGKVAKS